MLYRCVHDLLNYCEGPPNKKATDNLPDYGFSCLKKPVSRGRFLPANKVLVPMGKKLSELKRLKKKAGGRART